MRDSKWLRIALILWVVALIILSKISLEPGLYDSVRILLIGIGALLLAYMAGLHKVISLSLFAYLLIASLIAYIVGSRAGLPYTISVILLLPVVAVAVYAWIKRPKP